MATSYDDMRWRLDAAADPVTGALRRSRSPLEVYQQAMRGNLAAIPGSGVQATPVPPAVPQVSPLERARAPMTQTPMPQAPPSSQAPPTDVLSDMTEGGLPAVPVEAPGGLSQGSPLADQFRAAMGRPVQPAAPMEPERPEPSWGLGRRARRPGGGRPRRGAWAGDAARDVR